MRKRAPAVLGVALFAFALHASERDALRSLYQAFAGEQWKHAEGWLSDAPLGEWHGITVQSGHVIEVDLAGNRLLGQLPEGLEELGHLDVLDLRWNAISGVIPDSLARTANLEILLLSGNQLTGQIPGFLGSMPALRRLDLSYNRLSGAIPAALGESRSLQSVGLQHNRLTGSLPKALSRIGTLQRLIAHGNGLTGPVPREFDQLPALTHLKLDDNAADRRSNGITGLDMLDETTAIIDEEAVGFVRQVMAAIIVRNGELYFDAAKTPYAPLTDKFQDVIEGINERLREAGETIESVNDFERALELNDEDSIEIPDPALGFPHGGEEPVLFHSPATRWSR